MDAPLMAVQIAIFGLPEVQSIDIERFEEQEKRRKEAGLDTTWFDAQVKKWNY